MEADHEHVLAMAHRLHRGITSQLKGVVLNGPESESQHYAGCLNLSFAYVEGESLIMGLKVCASSIRTLWWVCLACNMRIYDMQHQIQSEFWALCGEAAT